jgi:hypothetical protein
MKMSLHLYRLIMVILIVILIPISSCHLFGPPNPSENMIAPENINIEGADTSTNELELKDDNGNSAKIFKVKAGKKIRWLVNTREVGDIDSIYKKPTTTSDLLFKAGPSRIGNSRNWTATIDPEAKPEQYEDYNIDWTDKNGGKHTFDPRIQVKP